MIRWLGRWGRRLLVALLVALLCLSAPIVYTELACQSNVAPDGYRAILPAEHHRAESRTLLTYPEWHIVHAYDDYAKVISDGDPHDFGYWPAIAGFWSSLCTVSRQAGAMGGIPGETKQMVYVIGASFTLELALKAAYEETIGRLFAGLRGQSRAPLDDLSARQARDYASFLQQVPWYRWDFRSDRAALRADRGTSFRDRERVFALGLEYATKAAYAKAIAAAVASVGPDNLRLRMIVKGLDAGKLSTYASVDVIGLRDEGIEIETPRYRALTGLLEQMATAGGTFVEIAGNDTIMFTAVSSDPTARRAVQSVPRQGYGDWRHLIVLPVGDLAGVLRQLPEDGLKLEHVHDY
jgi:hypothetical protein